MKKLVSVIAALAMVATFAMSAAAADWSFYGSARIETFVDSNGSDVFSLDQPGNARIGSNVAVSDELTARFEYGSGPNLRLLYATWNFGAGSLLVGQDYTPIGIGSGYSQQFKNGNTGMIGYGMPYGSRVPQIKLNFGNFSIAAMHNTDLEEDVQGGIAGAASKMIMGEDGYGYDTGADNYGAWTPSRTENTAVLANGTTINTFWAVRDLAIADQFASTYAGNISTEVTLPRLEARYFYDFGPVRLRAAGGYASVELNDNNDPDVRLGDKSFDADAYFLGFGGKYAQGPFYVEANYGMGENLSVLGIATTTAAMAGFNDDYTGLVDAETDMYYILAGFKFNEMVAAEIGWGKEETEIGAAEEEAVSYYLTLPITLAPGVMVRPEVGVFDEDDAASATKTEYYGVTWQINF